jgi:hypothetical protein
VLPRLSSRVARRVVHRDGPHAAAVVAGLPGLLGLPDDPHDLVVSASNSSSRVPKPPGRMTKACAYFTNIVLRTKK